MMYLLACATPEPRMEASPAIADRAYMSTLPTNWGVADLDAACLREGVEVGVAVELAHEQAFDRWIGALAPYSADLPIPDLCGARVAVYVESTSATDVTVCARLAAGLGVGRAVCASPPTAAIEQSVAVMADPAEAGEADEEADILTSIARVAAGFDTTRAPRDVRIDPRDGRVVFDQPGDRAHACARQAVTAVATAELSYDAGFDGFSTDLTTLGWSMSSLTGDCEFYVAVRVPVADKKEFVVQSVVLEGELTGHSVVAGLDRVVAEGGPAPADRTFLSANGWTVGDAPPR